MTDLKGVHDIPTAQSLVNRSMPTSRADLMTQLARMEREQAKLERELDLWIGKQRKTQKRLRQIQQRMELLQRALDESSGDQKRRHDDVARQRADVESRASKPARVVSLEY